MQYPMYSAFEVTLKVNLCHGKSIFIGLNDRD